jgi:preprotein translocase subunit SecG
MDIWLTLILTVHVLVARAIIFLVLLQHGKGADMGAAFGSGSSGSLFGATGSANFLSRTTAALAVVFFLTSLGLAYVATHKPRTGTSVMQGTSARPAAAASPASDVPKPANEPAAPKANDSEEASE